jgi:hypothetical protein
LYNVLVHWEGDTNTYKSLEILATDAPLICERRAKVNDLLDTPDWKTPQGYKTIRGHGIFDIKHDGRHRNRFVVGIRGHGLFDIKHDGRHRDRFVARGQLTIRSVKLLVLITAGIMRILHIPWFLQATNMFLRSIGEY